MGRLDRGRGNVHTETICPFSFALALLRPRDTAKSYMGFLSVLQVGKRYESTERTGGAHSTDLERLRVFFPPR